MLIGFLWISSLWYTISFPTNMLGVTPKGVTHWAARPSFFIALPRHGEKDVEDGRLPCACRRQWPPDPGIFRWIRSHLRPWQVILDDFGWTWMSLDIFGSHIIPWFALLIMGISWVMCETSRQSGWLGYLLLGSHSTRDASTYDGEGPPFWFRCQPLDFSINFRYHPRTCHSTLTGA